MAIANTKSSIVTGLDLAIPAVANSSIHKARLLEQSTFLEVLAADDNNSVYRFHRIPSNARLSQLLIMNDVITLGSDYNFGLHETAENGGAVADDNLFSDAVTMVSARDIPVDIYDAVVEEDREQLIWELLGLSEDPHKDYDLSATGIVVGTSAGTIHAIARYAI